MTSLDKTAWGVYRIMSVVISLHPAEKSIIFWQWKAIWPRNGHIFGQTSKESWIGRKIWIFSDVWSNMAENQVFSRPFGEKRLKNPEQNELSQKFRTGNEPILYGASKIRQFVQEKAESCTKRSLWLAEALWHRRWPQNLHICGKIEQFYPIIHNSWPFVAKLWFTATKLHELWLTHNESDQDWRGNGLQEINFP